MSLYFKLFLLQMLIIMGFGILLAIIPDIGNIPLWLFLSVLSVVFIPTIALILLLWIDRKRDKKLPKRG